MKRSAFIATLIASVAFATIQAVPAVQAAPFVETFENYAPGSSLAGQGGWYQSPTFTAPLIIDSGTGLGSKVVDGTFRTGNGSYSAASISVVLHDISAYTDVATAITLLSFDAHAASANRSHASGIFLQSSTGTTYVGWSADWFDSVNREQAKWQFATPVGNEIVLGGFDQISYLEVILDPASSSVFGRAIFGSTINTTSRYTLTPTQIDSISTLAIQQDYRDPSYLGVELDNISVSSVSASSVPEPSVYALFGGGALLLLLNQRMLKRGA